MHVLTLFPDMYVFNIFNKNNIITSYRQLNRTWFSCGNVKILLIFKYHVYFNREIDEHKAESSDRLAVPVRYSLHLCFITKCLITSFWWYSDSLGLQLQIFSVIAYSIDFFLLTMLNFAKNLQIFFIYYFVSYFSFIFCSQ